MYKTILIQTFLIAFLTGICMTTVYSQKVKKATTSTASNNVQINSKLDSLYADYDNDIEIKIPTPYNIYGITVSQGSIRNNDDSAKNISGLNIISNLNTGTVTITIYKNNQVYKQRTFGVKEKTFPQYPRYVNKNSPIQPLITIGSIDSGNIKRNTLTKVNNIVINSPYKILKYSLVLQPDNLLIYNMNTIYFSEEIKRSFEHLNMNRTIIVQDIYFEDSEANIYRYDHVLIYKVID